MELLVRPASLTSHTDTGLVARCLRLLYRSLTDLTSDSTLQGCAAFLIGLPYL